jgi:hypothetical protein
MMEVLIVVFTIQVAASPNECDELNNPNFVLIVCHMSSVNKKSIFADGVLVASSATPSF